MYFILAAVFCVINYLVTYTEHTYTGHALSAHLETFKKNPQLQTLTSSAKTKSPSDVLRGKDNWAVTLNYTMFVGDSSEQYL